MLWQIKVHGSERLVVIEDHVVRWILLSPLFRGNTTIDNIIATNGRPMVRHRKGSRYTSLARAVAMNFLGTPPAGAVISTIDGDPYNIRVSNLQWITAAELGKRVLTVDRPGLYKGVINRHGKYVALVHLKSGRSHRLGIFNIAEEAAAAHKAAQFEMGDVSYFR